MPSFDLHQSDRWASYLSSQGWKVEEVQGKNQKAKIKIYIRKIPLIGSVIKIQRPAEIPPVEEIDQIAHKHRALFVKIEPLAEASGPYQRLTEGGFTPDPTPNLPTKTIIIDLTKTEKELWKDLSQDARQSVHRTQGRPAGGGASFLAQLESNKLVVTSSQGNNKDFEEKLKKFQPLLKETGRRQRFWVLSYEQLKSKAEAFGKDAILFLAHSKSEAPLAGGLFLVSEETAFYHHAASSPEGRERHAPYLLLWEALKWLKHSKIPHRSPILYLDLEGIGDERFPRTRDWEKFTVFKGKWGGKEVEFPPPLIKYYSSLLKPIFKLLDPPKGPGRPELNQARQSPLPTE